MGGVNYLVWSTTTSVAFLKARQINYLISAKLTQALQQAIVDKCQWLQVAPGLEVSELLYTPQAWGEYLDPQRLVVVRQHMKRKEGGVPGKTLSLFADDPDLQGWRYGAILTDLSLPAVEAWRLYRGRRRLREPHQSVEGRFRPGQLRAARLLGHRGRTGGNDAGV